MTDNTQELDEILDGLHESGCSVIEGMNYPRSVAAGMYKCDCGVLDAKQAILDWHNKQVEAELEARIDELVDMHRNIMDNPKWRSDAPDQAFAYARVHRIIDERIDQLKGETK